MMRVSTTKVCALLFATTVPCHTLSSDKERKSSSFCGQEGWQQVWSDEFNGTTLDTVHSWTKDVGDNHDSRTRDARATADSVWVDTTKGALVIRSNATWNVTGQNWYNMTSGAISSQHKQHWKGHTRVCVRAKLPGATDGKGRGIWPAHWLLPNDSTCWPCHGEIDIVEMINGDGLVRGTYHWCTNHICGGKQHSHKSSGGHIHIRDWDTAWHEFAVEYGVPSSVSDPTKPLLSFALDGKIYHQVSLADEKVPLVWPEAPYYAILNTAVGGPWPDPPNETASTMLQHTQFPTYHWIDWIRVAQPKAANKQSVLKYGGCSGATLLFRKPTTRAPKYK